MNITLGNYDFAPIAQNISVSIVLHYMIVGLWQKMVRTEQDPKLLSKSRSARMRLKPCKGHHHSTEVILLRLFKAGS